MNLESYAMFLVGTILVSTSIVVIGLMLLFLNFIFTKYWRPVNFGYWAPFWVTDL
jgi:Zn-dependent membrane protease YugP